MKATSKKTRHLVFILGDQLNLDSAALADFDVAQDMILMAEVDEESTHVWSHKTRAALFLSAMRHFAQTLTKHFGRHLNLHYLKLGEHPHKCLGDALFTALSSHTPAKIIVVEPGDYRVQALLLKTAIAANTPLTLRDDTHFLISKHAFAQWAKPYKQMRMEFFYRHMRKTHDVMMDGAEPVGGKWNFDADNRGAFGKAGPEDLPLAPSFAPDGITQEVFDVVEKHFKGHPGSLAHFIWPVDREQALAALKGFMRDRMAYFGLYQDAMWMDEPLLYHSLLSSSLNLKLLNPREVIDAAIAEWQAGRAPIEAVEGFVRQVLGWREFIRGMYWMDMPNMKIANHFNHQRPLPEWYWSGKTDMRCMQQSIKQTLDYGYAHHIQRLMITGIFGLLAEIEPSQVADWYLAVYVDAVEWVELPNVAGMALYANGGRFTSKPYIASGAYVKRMSNYCGSCRYKPELKTGPKACPITTLYWNFLIKHETEMAKNPRTSLMVRNVARFDDDERAAIQTQAATLLTNINAA
jgi:deoxyribodipyrimidine photolyase-related protein